MGVRKEGAKVMSFDYNEYENEMIKQSIVEGDRLASIVYGCARNNVNCENCDASVICNDLDKQLTEQQLFDSAQNVMFEWMGTMFANCLDAYGAKQYTKDTKLCESCMRKRVCALSDGAFVTECKFYKEKQ